MRNLSMYEIISFYSPSLYGRILTEVMSITEVCTDYEVKILPYRLAKLG